MKPIIFLAAAIVILSVLFILIRPHTASQKSLSVEPDAAVIDAESNTKIFKIEVRNGNIISGPTIMEASEGNSVVIKVTVDTNEELHLHGYDKSVDLSSGAEGELSFIANITGRFPFELEHSKIELGFLDVMPQ